MAFKLEGWQDPMFAICPSGDYLHVVCLKCNESCEMDYKGRDPVMVLVEINCKNCGSTGKWKLHDAGFGFGQPDTNFEKKGPGIQ